ncbi:MAG TPA: hypothetical protein VF647_07280 [Longimicrobium sp.]
MIVLTSPSANRDVERHYERLKHLASRHIASPRRHDIWFAEAEVAILALRQDALIHPLAPEHKIWGRKVRVTLFARGYRLLYEIHADMVWVLRVRAQAADPQTPWSGKRLSH